MNDENSKEQLNVKFAPRRLGHANVGVADLQRSMDFYVNICGFQDVGVERGTAASFVSNGNTHHDFGLTVIRQTFYGKNGEVLENANPKEVPGLNHLGWEVDTEAKLIDAIERSRAAGLPQNLVNHEVSHSIYVVDPDGNCHEFYADVRKDWRALYSGGELPNFSSHWSPGEASALDQPMWDPNPIIQIEPGAPIQPLRTSRAVMVVSDVERLLPFYTDVAGLEVIHAAPDRSYVYLRGSAPTRDFHCAILKSVPGLGVGCHHASCELADEASVSTAEAKLAETGTSVVRSIDSASKRSFFVADPDGFLIEFYVNRDPDFAALLKEPMTRRPFAA